jgi:parallel beta-helix repeat protein
VVDASGCACSQKICPAGDETTIYQCYPEEIMGFTATCWPIPDADQDDVTDEDDNCPSTFNPGQLDCNGNGIGDQCEIGLVDADTTLQAGVYCIDDTDLQGAVTITASNVLLDCDGATILGTGVGYGIYLPDHVTDVTVQNCTVRNYRYGMYLDGTSGNQIISNTLDTNTYGVLLGASSTNVITHNVVMSNALAGLYLEDSGSNSIVANTVLSNSRAGILLYASDSFVQQNIVCSNTSSDFEIYDSTGDGGDNTCDNPGDWSDEGASGCSYACSKVEQHKLYLPIILKKPD